MNNIESLAKLAEKGALSLDKILEVYEPLPVGSLLLGLGRDGLPVMLNMEDAAPGPLLIAGDAGSGKTEYLKSVVRQLELRVLDNEVVPVVLSATPEEWGDFAFQIGSPEANDQLNKVAQWSVRGGFVLLMIDGLEAISQMDAKAQRHLDDLLSYGPARSVWPIVTYDTLDLQGEHLQWIARFRTRLYGHIGQKDTAFYMTNDESNIAGTLRPGVELMMHEPQMDGSQWLRFWMPTISS